jgi:hypothetical protein
LEKGGIVADTSHAMDTKPHYGAPLDLDDKDPGVTQGDKATEIALFPSSKTGMARQSKPIR